MAKATGWRVVDLVRRVRDLGGRPYRKIDRARGHSVGRPLRQDLEEMTVGLEAERDLRAVGAAGRVFFVVASGTLSGRRLTNQWLPLLEMEAAETLRGVLMPQHEDWLEMLARWMMHAAPGDSKTSGPAGLVISIRCVALEGKSDE